MLMSMTGFAVSTITLPIKDGELSLTLSLKTLNARFFESTCKLPYNLAELETIALKIFKAKLFRGTIFFNVHVHNLSLLKGNVSFSSRMVEQYLAAIKRIQQETGIEGNPQLHDLITLPNIFETTDEILPTQATELIVAEIHKLVDAVIAARLQEGKALLHDIQQRAQAMQQLIAQIEPRAQQVVAEKKAALSEALANLPYQETENKEQHLLTLYTQLDRIDIHEEIVRFKTHLAHFETVLKNTDFEKGKKMDFILQEMFREINTMNAKCNDSQISQAAISVKVELEKAREQVQNIV